MNRVLPTAMPKAQTPLAFMPMPTSLSQPKCGCSVAGECGECGRKKLSSERSTENPERQPLVHDSSALVESAFGHNFGNVRVDIAPQERSVAAAPFESRLADPGLPAEDQPFAQVLGERNDPVHAPMLGEYRRRAGLPPGGIDEFGNRVGPSDAELKYGGTLVMPGAAQSTARFTPGAVHNTWNLAPRIAAGNTTLGFTPPLLNGNQIMSAADAIAAIHRPSLGNRTTATGAECWIDTIPYNDASFEMTLPTAGPWTTVTSKASISAIVPNAACTGAGNTTFTVRGDPSDAAALANIQRHEQRHAADHERIFNTVAVPWHTAMTRARDPRRTFNGANVAACEATLYASLGGTPDQIATNLWNGWIGANNAFHGSPAGATGSITGTNANADCSVSSINFMHP